MRVSELIEKLREIEENGGGEDFVVTNITSFYDSYVEHVKQWSYVVVGSC